ncbi:MAG TPA: HIT family protein [Thermoanaerobaculia bacterium]|nr:HIT family protein [Thermoanaerobaculia bacterium]
MACVFCTDAATAGDLVYEDEHAFVLLHPDWSPRGHAMVVAKAHVENVSGLEEEAWLHLARVWHRAETVLLEATGAERAMVLKLGIQTPHLHVHIYPVSAAASRDEVFAAFDGKSGEPCDEAFVREVRARMGRRMVRTTDNRPLTTS